MAKVARTRSTFRRHDLHELRTVTLHTRSVNTSACRGLPAEDWGLITLRFSRGRIVLYPEDMQSPTSGKGDTVSVSEPPPSTDREKRPNQGLTRRQALLLLAGVAVAGGAGAAAVATRDADQSSGGLDSADPQQSEAVGAGDRMGNPATGKEQSAASQRPRILPPLPYPAVSMWLNTFEQPTLQNMPADVMETLNLVVFAIAHSARSGTGQLNWQPRIQSHDQAVESIAALTGQNTPVLLGVGGSDDGGITVTNADQADEFCQSIRELVQDYGFTGVDIDLEPSGSSWQEDSLISVVRTLKEEYGSNFIIGLTVGLYGEHSARWVSLARELNRDLDYWSPMLYDYEEAHDERLVADALKKTQFAVDGGIPATKHILGFMCNSYYNTSPVPVTAAVWEAVRKAHPGVRGAFIWESSLEHEFDYEWTRQVGASIRNGD